MRDQGKKHSPEKIYEVPIVWVAGEVESNFNHQTSKNWKAERGQEEWKGGWVFFREPHSEEWGESTHKSFARRNRRKGSFSDILGEQKRSKKKKKTNGKGSARWGTRREIGKREGETIRRKKKKIRRGSRSSPAHAQEQGQLKFCERIKGWVQSQALKTPNKTLGGVKWGGRLEKGCRVSGVLRQRKKATEPGGELFWKKWKETERLSICGAGMVQGEQWWSETGGKGGLGGGGGGGHGWSRWGTKNVLLVGKLVRNKGSALGMGLVVKDPFGTKARYKSLANVGDISGGFVKCKKRKIHNTKSPRKSAVLKKKCRRAPSRKKRRIPPEGGGGALERRGDKNGGFIGFYPLLLQR